MLTGNKVLTPRDWVQVVIVAGIGSILEWFDMFSYSQLDGTIKKAFFSNETGYWTVFGMAMAARPVGAILFGHIGDTAGRGRSLMLGIMLMAVSTCAIGALPTNDVGPYTAGKAAPILLAIFRVLQGLAMGGEFGAAVTYVSELAQPEWRCRYTSALQATAQLGLVLALALVMVLQATVSSYDMEVWGWRIPFIFAFFTALLGFWMRRGMPEPHAFLAAARKERLVSSRIFSKRQLSLLGDGPDAEWEAAADEKAAAAGQGGAAKAVERPAGEGADVELPHGAEKKGLSEEEGTGKGVMGGGAPVREVPFETATSMDHGRLSSLHLNVSHSKVPIFRVIRNNWAGLLIQTMYTACVSAAFYATTSWLPSKLKMGYLPTRVSQGILLASMPACVAGMLTAGWAMDKGVRAVTFNAAVITVGGGTSFGVFYGSFNSDVAAWLVSPAFLFLVGMGITLIGVPGTRLYAPLERISGYSLGYNLAMGVIGGFTPNICNAIKGSISDNLVDYSAAFWVLATAVLSLAGAALLLSYAPRLNHPYVGRLE